MKVMPRNYSLQREVMNLRSWYDGPICAELPIAPPHITNPFLSDARQEECGGTEQQPTTHAGTPILLRLWKWVIGKISVRA